jgi:serine/threonine protein kinase
MATASQTITVGAGRYRLTKKLGEGEFGEVHLADDLDEGGLVAVKLFKPGVKLDAALQEGRLQRRLSEHPRIVGLRNLDVRSGAGPIVVSEYMEHGSVAQAIGTGSAGLLLALRWTVDAADALVHAHANGVFHRDCKPSNLLLDGSGHATLCDFGVAEEPLAGAPGPMYMALAAPELTQGHPTSVRSEVWMLGALFYRLLVGTYPYPAGAAGAQAISGVPDPQLPMNLVRVVKQALAPDPADRQTDVTALRSQLLATPVTTEFQGAAAPGTLARWQASVPAGEAIVEVVSTPRSTFQARLRVDRGSGPRTASAPARRTSEAQALRDARTLLHGVVEGRLP